MDSKSYSLWLCPPRGCALDLTAAACIASLSATLCAPEFRPHVTLIGTVGSDPTETASQIEARVCEPAPACFWQAACQAPARSAKFPP
mmetsp:Transcript_99046/g.144874  ORF Transcript_99046/g.144874 Transcript_99046/m.144874 type:complete len:88 (-) Transcript_99046:71-334(-)